MTFGDLKQGKKFCLTAPNDSHLLLMKMEKVQIVADGGREMRNVMILEGTKTVGQLTYIFAEDANVVEVI